MLGAARRRSMGFSEPASGTTNTVPTYDGSGIIIHPSVVDMGALWHGYRWWRADTPYPDVYHENPSIWGSNDRVTWEVPDGLVNPIDPYPGPGINSDTELVWDPVGQRLVVYWREYNSGPIKWWAASSRDGVTWRHHGARLTMASSDANLSAGIARDPTTGEWRALVMKANGNGVVYTAPDVLGPWAAGTALTGWYPNDSVAPYHGDMIWHRGVWLAVFSGGTIRDCYAAASADGYAWTVGETIVASGYRPTMVPSAESGYMDVWTSSTSTYDRVAESQWLDLLPAP